ncbi:MAG TPA: histidine--tRNA ligase [Candidatus Dormibacteraeota bacterium]|jgi:histidyl-tRNA synthetase|nr:histidine--tRNA ligase [Candidatus Dormibacteraeota bacterium]
MASKSKFQAIRGTRDLLPPDTALWNHVEETAHAVFGTFGFGEIRPPIFEPSDLFARAVGGETDIVSKEMFSFWDPFDPRLPSETRIQEANARGMKIQDETQAAAAFVLGMDFQSISLRPEATASVCRAYIEHNMQQLPQPQKLYYIGPMFRRERPQKGRYRQFYQIGAEVLENVKPDPTRDAAKELTKDAITDAEVIQMVMTFFDKLKLPGVHLEINSIGHAADNCRRGYVALLKSELEKVKDKLGADSQRRIETNPLRVLDSKLEHEQPIIEKLPRIADHLCDECKTHYAAIKRELELRGVFYKENWRLVRGLDYYMRTTFEITAQGLGSQNAVCGGGRYDGLVELLGGPPTKGIGFAIGEDRLILSLQEAMGASSTVAKQPPFIYIAWMGPNAYAAAVHAAKDLRAANIRVELPPTEQKFGKALERASKLGAHYALILGDNEVAEGTWTLKTLADGTQQKLTEPQLLDFLRKQIPLSS